MAGDRKLHPSIAHFVPLFRYEHLPPHLQDLSKPFGARADHEATVSLRKLLEAKDCAVRAAVVGGFAHEGA